MLDRGRDFADIVYTILVPEKSTRLERAAGELGMAYATLHSRVINRTCFSADEIRKLVRTIGDPRLVSYLLDGTGFVAAVRPSGDPEDQLSIQRGATRIVVEATDVLEVVDAALAGGGLDHRHKAIVLREIEQAELALASLRVQVEAPSSATSRAAPADGPRPPVRAGRSR